MRSSISGIAAGALMAGGLLAGTFNANAGVIDYRLRNVTFDDGGTASGTFTVDSTTGSIGTATFTTTAGAALPGYSYSWPNPNFSLAQPGPFALSLNPATSFFLINYTSQYFVEIQFQHNLNLGGVDPIYTATLFPFGLHFSWECANCYPIRYVTGGAAVAVVPEPPNVALLGLGLLGLAAIRQRNAC